MPLGKRQRRILLAFGVLIGGLGLLWFSTPLWFPWVFRPVVRGAGVHYARYAREGYDRFVLYGFSYTNQSLELRADRVEALTPTVWLWRLEVGAKSGQQPFLSIHGWHLKSLPARKATAAVGAQAKKPGGELGLLRRWVPGATLSNGVVEAQSTRVEVPAATWSRGRLWSQVRIPKLGQELMLSVNTSNAPPYRVQVRSETLHLDSRMVVSTNATGLTLSSTHLWWNNRIQLQAQFGPAGILPQEARLEAPHFDVPASLAELPGYHDVQGSLHAEWKQGQFVLDVDAHAAPRVVQTHLPPLDIVLQAHGNTNGAIIQTATVTAPWLQAQLSHELVVHYHWPLLREPGTLHVTANLSRQHWFKAEGTLNGQARFYPRTGKLPAIAFDVSGSQIGIPQIKTERLQLRGNLDWPWLNLTNATALFRDGSTASLAAELQVHEKRIKAGRLAVAGPLGRRWLPGGYSYQELSVSARFDGPLTNLNHSGSLTVTNFTSPQLRPLDLALDWQGRQENLSRTSIAVSARRGSLNADGALTLHPGGGDLLLKELTLRQSGKTLLTLAAPVPISVHYDQTGSARLRAAVPSLRWAGAGGEVKFETVLDWPKSGRFEVAAQGLHSELLEPFLKSSMRPVVVQKLDLSAGWTNAPLNFHMELSAAGREEIPLSAQVTVSGDAKGISVEQLDLTSRSALVVNAKGFLPITFNPAAASGLVEIRSNAPVHLEAVTGTASALWNKVAALTGVQVEAPQVALTCSGTVNDPRGQLRLQARQLRLWKEKEPMPRLENLDLTVQFEPRLARLVQGRLLVQDQPVKFTGELPLPEDFWAGLPKRRWPGLDKASGRVQMPNAKLAAFTSLYSSVLSPQGELNLDLSLVPGFKLQGDLTVRNARTRPLPGLGPVRDITVAVKFQEQRVELQSATANLGGSTVRMTGTAEWSAANFRHHTLPPFSFSLSGTNIPLVRKPEAIIRGDLLLAATKTNGAPPLVAGVVHLRDSYFLSDLTALLPGKIATPRERPPYFSLNEPLVANWRLGVHVTGDRFLKARTTLFNGEVSANFQVQGTLKNPVAVGDTTIDSGVVSFPFGSLQVQQGFVTITSENPYEPQLSVSATSKQFGYDIKMEVSGPADAPVIQFSSTPPLTSEQILLLLTTGQMPQGSFTLTPQQRAQTLAMFLARDVLSKLGFGNVGESRLTIHSGQEISETGKPTYTIEFRLTKNWSLVGEYDRFGDYNAGVKWRVYSR